MSENPMPTPEPLESALTDAYDRLRLNHWLPPQNGIVPRIRIGSRWISVLWGLPIGTTALIVLIAIAPSLRELPGVAAFIKRYPGIAQAAPSVDSGFPWWLQLQHFVNMLFMLFIIRAGIQILADHPRLYWKRDSTPGTDWFRFQRSVPKGRVWLPSRGHASSPAPGMPARAADRARPAADRGSTAPLQLSWRYAGGRGLRCLAGRRRVALGLAHQRRHKLGKDSSTRLGHCASLSARAWTSSRPKEHGFPQRPAPHC